MSGRRICFISSEVAPYAKTGGLADVSGALPRYVGEAGNDVRVFMPLYSTIDVSNGRFHRVDFLRNLTINFGGDAVTFDVVTTKLHDSDVDLYLVDSPRLYHRGTVYTDHEDEYLRFALLSRAAIECCQHMGWSPDVFHCNDWQTALVPLYLKTVYKWDGLFERSRTVLTIHNIAYQGVFSSTAIEHLGLGEYREMFSVEDMRDGIVNFMKTGIFYADLLTTVSVTYAREIQTPEFGAGLEDFLRWRGNALHGIVNGVDYNEWSPEGDAWIPYPYSAEELSWKEENKKYLLGRINLTYDPDAPLLGIVSRLTGQKGFDLFFDILRPFLAATNVRLAVLGSGEPRYEDFFTGLQHDFHGRVCFYRGFQNELAHLVEAGSDIFLMPSRFEPCGLNQIYSLRYGTVPVVRRTGGLADTVQQFDPATGEGTGFVFEHFTPDGLLWAMGSATELWHNKAAWERLMLNGMAKNYSWEVQVLHYLALYQQLAG
ncbi:MAG TPA: glycogen synthase GlgA [Candidatus Kapabacteria bacterium]|nr:glycogen synthase GlgA [Candidatus Kapabacteria bacterium]